MADLLMLASFLSNFKLHNSGCLSQNPAFLLVALVFSLNASVDFEALLCDPRV